MYNKYQGKGFVQLTGRNSMSQTAWQNVTLTPSISASSSNLNSWLSNVSLNDNDHHHHSVKKYEVYETPVSVIALSCTMQRLRKSNPGVKYRLLDPTVLENVKPDDVQRATDIKDYYSKKIMMGKLSEQFATTSFRDDMNKLIHSDGLIFKQSDIGIACFLPTFYEQDIQLDEVKRQVKVNQNFDNMNKQGLPYKKETSVNLMPLKKITRRNKRTEVIQYWLKDDTLDAGVMIELKKENPLLHLWEYMFENESIIKVKGMYTRRKLDEFEYFLATDWAIDHG